jgi:gustatory receptor
MNFVLLLKDRFSLLHTRLSSLSGIFEIGNSNEGVCLPMLKCISVKERKPELGEKDVLFFNNIHNVLCDAVLLVTSAYELQLLFASLNSFANMTNWLYFGLCYFYGYRGAHNKGVVVSNLLVSGLLWCLQELAKLLCITVSCHLASNEMRQTSVVIRKLHLADRHEAATVAELDRFLHHVATHQFKFTAFSFLNLDFSLLVSVLGAVCTYLVILMQFNISDKTSPTCCRNMTD